MWEDISGGIARLINWEISSKSYGKIKPTKGLVFLKPEMTYLLFIVRGKFFLCVSDKTRRGSSLPKPVKSINSLTRVCWKSLFVRARSQESPSQESGVTEEELGGDKNSLKSEKVIGF